MQKDTAITTVLCFKTDEQDFPLEIIDNNGEKWVTRKQLEHALGVGNLGTLHSRLVRRGELKEKIHFMTFRVPKALKKNGSPHFIGYSYQGIRKILSKTRGINAKETALKFGFMDMVVQDTEIKYLEIIIRAISGILAYKTQYYVDKYKIDLYLPEINLAIEVDENGHTDRDYDYEREREYHISHTLCCEIIRINPDEPGFNIGNTINMVLKRACLQKIDGKQSLIPLKMINGKVN